MGLPGDRDAMRQLVVQVLQTAACLEGRHGVDAELSAHPLLGEVDLS